MKPFQIFPWSDPFLPYLKKFIDQQGDALDSLVIVPNNRPRRYIVDLYKKEGKPAIVPKVMTFEEMARVWRGEGNEAPEKLAQPLDQAALLYEAVKMVDDQYRLERIFAKMSLADFLPWGLELAKIIESTYVQAVEPGDFPVEPEEAGELPAAILSSLKRIRENYQSLLHENGMTTPGLDIWKVLHTDRIPEALLPGESRSIFMAGFYALDGSANILLRKLWDNGAFVCLHTDPALAGGGTAQWACQEHAKWIRRWNAATELNHPPMGKQPKISFFSGYDTHTQLNALAHDFQDSSEESVALVLTHPDLLMPALHHLPSKNINISMGYPLDRTTMHDLFESMFNMQFSRNRKGEYYHKDFLDFIGQPYLKMLAIVDQDGKSHNLRKIFNHMGRSIGKGLQYIDLESFWNEYLDGADEYEVILLAEIKSIFFTPFKEKMTTAELGSIITRIDGLFSKYGGKIWKRFPLDAEVMQRIKDNLAPVLKDSLVSGQELDLRLVHSIMDDLMASERVAFEADPIIGSQILGMFETRLLQFDKLFILDATEDYLPGASAPNPLLPDSLRGILGLPDSHLRENIAAYNITRLVNCSKEANFLWQEGQYQSGLIDGKKSRSRFIEELIWQAEQEANKIFKPGEGPLKVAHADISLEAMEPASIPRTPQIDKALNEFLARSISPSALDVYLACPFKFITRYILNIAPEDAVEEGEDRAVIGTFLHDVLEDLLTPWKGKELKKNDISPEMVDEAFFRILNNRRYKEVRDLEGKIRQEGYLLKDLLPADSYIWLKTIGPEKLKKYFKDYPKNPSTIMALEEKCQADVPILGEVLKFRGKIDRLDKRDSKLHVLDYKSGNVESLKIDEKFWKDQDLFDQLREFIETDAPVDEKANDLLDKIREHLKSIQLFVYVMMVKEKGLGEVANAALVNLVKNGSEIELFKGSATREQLEQCEIVLAFLMRHLKKSTVYEPCENDFCDKCEYRGLCGI